MTADGNSYSNVRKDARAYEDEENADRSKLELACHQQQTGYPLHSPASESLFGCARTHCLLPIRLQRRQPLMCSAGTLPALRTKTPNSSEGSKLLSSIMEVVKACCVDDAGMRQLERLVTTQSPTTRLPQNSAVSCIPALNTYVSLTAGLHCIHYSIFRPTTRLYLFNHCYVFLSTLCPQVNDERDDAASIDQLTTNGSR